MTKKDIIPYSVGFFTALAVFITFEAFGINPCRALLPFC